MCIQFQYQWSGTLSTRHPQAGLHSLGLSKSGMDTDYLSLTYEINKDLLANQMEV
jgi:hypothetical protein